MHHAVSAARLEAEPQQWSADVAKTSVGERKCTRRSFDRNDCTQAGRLSKRHALGNDRSNHSRNRPKDSSHSKIGKAESGVAWWR